MLAARSLLVLGLVVSACTSPEGDGGFSSWTAGPLESTGDGGTSSSGTFGPPGTSGTTGTTTTGNDWPDPVPTTVWMPDPTPGGTTSGPTTTEPGTTTTGVEPEDPCPRVRVLVPPGDTLNVRPAPSTAMAAIGSLSSGAIVDVLAVVDGEVIDGLGTWYQVDGPWAAGYVFGGWVECTLDEPATDGFFLPLACGTTTTVTQGNFGDFSHQGNSAYAFDFSLAMGTPLVAIADGTVTKLYADTMPGDPCYNGGGMECNCCANYVTLLHNDGTTSVYAHLSAVQVGLGDFVGRGFNVGLTGSTGWSTGPHAHVARQENCGGGFCQSIAVTFTDVAGDGVPKTGDSVTSQNCP